MQQQQQNDSRSQMREGINFVLLISQAFAVTCEAFLHRRHGRNWPGVQGVWGFILILLFPLLWPAENPLPLIRFLWAYIGACIVAKISVSCRRYDYSGHSWYSGTPRIRRLLPFFSENVIKRFVEPILVLATGLLFLHVSKPLGTYLILAAWGLAISTSAAEAWMRRQVDILNDSVIEQRNF